MAPSRRKGSKAAAAAAARRQWKVGDLVLAKVKGFPAWPATVSEPEKWGYKTDWKKVLVFFFGTKQIAFCNPADVEEFTEEKKISLLGKRQGRGADFVRAVQEIVDCYDKLKEKNIVDHLSSDAAAAGNAVVDALNETTTAVPRTSCDSAVRSSGSPKPKDETSLAGEDVGAVTDVESLQQVGTSEEPADNVALTLALPNTYTLRKKSRSVQIQRCSSQKKGSVQRSRSSSRQDSSGLQNGVPISDNGKSSGDAVLNGFWDGPLRKAKRSRRSPEECVPSNGDSPGKLNGTVDDNGAEIGMADSENLSNNEYCVSESEQKRGQSDVGNGSCEGSLELCGRFDFQARSSIVRKKRNPGRKRVHSDGLDTLSKSDQEATKDIRAQQDTMVLPTPCGNPVDRQLKDEGDEHLPLVKRARVRMGKLLSEEQEQLDCLVKTEEKPLESTSVVSGANTALKCDDVLPEENSLLPDEPIVSPSVDNSSQVPENKPPSERADTCVVNEPVACLTMDKCAQTTENNPQACHTKASQPLGSSFDGESALPPSKRLHRALEAMSANAAEESQTPARGTLSQKTNNDGAHFTLQICSSIHKDDCAVNNLGLGSDSVHDDDASQPLCDNRCRVANVSNHSACAVITEEVRDMALSDSCNRVTESVKMAEEVAVTTDGKDLSGSDSTGASHSDLHDQALETKLTIVAEPELILGSLGAVVSDLHPEEFRKSEDNSVAENNKSQSELHSQGCEDHFSRKEEIKEAGCQDMTALNSCSEEAKCSTAVDIPRVLASVNETADASNLGQPMEAVQHTGTNVDMDAASPPLLNDSSPQRTCHGASISGSPLPGQKEACVSHAELDVHKHGSQPDDLTALSNNHHLRQIENSAANTKFLFNKHFSDIAESRFSDTLVHGQTKCAERTNLVEVKATLASLELTLGSLTRTKESIGRATRIAVDCVKFGVAAELVDLLALYLEKEPSLHRRVDLFFLVDSIAQSTRALKGEVGGTYISAVKESLTRMLSAAAPAGQAAKENRRQCLKVLRLWLERNILPEFVVRQHIREIDSHNCPSAGGFSRRMSRTERSFDDPVLEMEGMLDEYGSNSSYQLPGFRMPRMLKEEEDGSDSDGGSFEAVTPEHDSKSKEGHETTVLPTTEKHRHILEDVDGELEMEDVAPSCNTEMDGTTTSAVDVAANAHQCREQFTSFVPPLPHDVPPHQPPLPTSPPPLPPLPPPPPPPPPLLVPHAPAMSHVDVDPQLHVGRNNMQETMSSRPPVPGVNHPLQMPASTSSCSYNSYPVMHNPVAPANNLQQADANLYCNKAYNLRPPYPTSSSQFSYHQTDQQFRPQREIQPPPYYEHTRYGPSVEGNHLYGEQDSGRPPRPEDGWGYSRPPFPSPSCEPMRPQNHGWGYPPPPVHHRNHIPSRPPCENGVPVGVRAPGYWRPR